jgi:hypothetical protein
MHGSKKAIWTRVITERYCAPTSELWLPGCFTCIAAMTVVHADGVLLVEVSDAVEFDNGDLVVKALGRAMRETENAQGQRMERGEDATSLQESTERVIACINAATMRMPLSAIRWVGGELARNGIAKSNLT